MTLNQLFQLYSNLNHGSPPLSSQALFSFPSINFDIYEDERSVVNRLFYILPLPATSSLFIFFEDNSFIKNPSGDLLLVNSSLHLYSHSP